MCLWPTANTGGQCGDGRGQVTETVGPSVVTTQKSGHKFCGIEWYRRKRERRPVKHSHVNLMKTVNTMRVVRFHAQIYNQASFLFVNWCF